MLLGQPLPVRKKHIAELLQSKTKRTWPFEFRNRLEDYPVFQVPLDFPKYRLANGRTLAAQEEWVVNNSLPPDLFTKDPELDIAQENQDKILRTMVNEEGLLAYFRKNEQKEPLVLSDMGFVVNGNRRLCAMRMLHAEDPTKFKHFAHIDVIFLPPATERELYELEVDLQIKPDIHARYHWLPAAKVLRRGRDLHNYSDEDLARIHGIRTKEVKEKIQLLEDAEEYLVERGKPRQYKLVLKAEYGLKKLREGRNSFKDEGDKVVFQKLAYVLLDDPSGTGRLYQAIPEVKENYDKIVERLHEQLELDESSDVNDEDLDLLGGADSKLALAAAVNDSANREVIFTTMMDVMESERIRAKDMKAANYPLKRIQEANTALSDAHSTLNPNAVLDGVSRQLDSIENSVQKIRQWLRENA